MNNRILLIDNEAEMRDLITIYLKKYGFQVITYNEGTKALEVFLKNLPSLIILEIDLPGLDGFELCRNLRYKTLIPIIFL